MNEQKNIQKFLEQQKTLFGNELFLNKIGQIDKNNSPLFTDKDRKRDLDQFCNSISLCKECELGNTRNNFVFGTGDSNADLMLVGEAPGEKEDCEGEPFVGRAGKLLDKILRAINKNRKKGVYITNVLKCRPPNNRDPLPSEVSKCEPYLLKQITMIQPKLIVALGRISGKTLLKKDIPLKNMREMIHNYHSIPLKVTYHPAALLRNPNFKKYAWEDFQWVRDYLAN